MLFLCESPFSVHPAIGCFSSGGNRGPRNNPAFKCEVSDIERADELSDIAPMNSSRILVRALLEGMEYQPAPLRLIDSIPQRCSAFMRQETYRP
ncbi:hypothetical protein NPIL_161181 [Nephila pilipes]|uniref:Uncharacterized protein n=1 Tax=Nephila pilipes TaxID=299642 RepID=A0A8X6N4Z5_NEPPI|nr:hypothetical protein NPIL_161181 [Nephila pilipes]